MPTAVGESVSAWKSADESRVSPGGNNFAQDNSLIIPVVAGGVYDFRLPHHVDAPGSAGGYKWKLTGINGASITGNCSYSGTTGLANNANDIDPTTGTGANTTVNVFAEQVIQGRFTNSGSDGDVVLEWAQFANNATATKIKKNSLFYAIRVA